MPGTRPTRPPDAPDAVERLYVYWLVSTALLVLVTVTVAIMTRGTLQQQALTINELSTHVTTLEEEIRDLRIQARRLPPAAPVPAVPAPVTEPEEPPRPEPPPAPLPRATPPVATPAPAIPSDEALRAQLDNIMSDAPVTPLDISAADEGLVLVATATQWLRQATWTGPTWLRLALLARLLERDVAAEAFAERAHAAHEPLARYAEVSARALLARGRPRDALPIAGALCAQEPLAAAPRILLAAAHLGADDPASADETLEALPLPVVVDTYDKLVLARVLLALEQWPRLAVVLGTVRDVPAELSAEHNFLMAVSIAHAARTVEALAILDALRAEQPAAAARATGGWRWPRPDRHEIDVWRGVTLMLAQQNEAARETLREAAARNPGRPEAEYYLGVLEARVGRVDVARAHLKNAVASAARLAPAWEALASLEINDDQLDAALDCLTRAVASNARRPLAHFLLAIVHAKRSQRERAADALRITFQLDSAYLGEAQQTDVLLRLFTPEELDALAAPSGLLGLPQEGAEEAGSEPP